jgi:uncharacterized membrane protein
VTKLLWEWLTKIHPIFTYIQNKFRRYRWRKNSLFVGLFFAVLILVIGNWKLLMATSCGAGIMFIIYRWQELNWQKYWLKFRELLTSSNGKFIIAVGSGGIVAIMTYMMAAIWEDAENRWLAAGTILQGLISVGILGLLGWQVFDQKLNSPKSEFDHLLINLSAKSSLKRLVALRKLNDLVKNNTLNSSQKSQLYEYFQLMLKVETEPIIRHVLQESLLFFNHSQSVINIKKPLQIPLKSEVLNVSFYQHQTQRRREGS